VETFIPPMCPAADPSDPPWMGYVENYRPDKPRPTGGALTRTHRESCLGTPFSAVKRPRTDACKPGTAVSDPAAA